MRKRVLYIITALVVIIQNNISAGNEPALNLSGTVKNVSSGKIYLKRYDNKSFFTIDSTVINKGKFRFTTKTQLPEIYGLSLSGSDEDPFTSFLVFLDQQPITINFDTENNFRNTVVTGSKEHDLFIALGKLKDKKIEEIIQEHPSSIAALYLLYRYYSFRLTSEEIKSNIALLDSSLQNTAYVKVLKELTQTLDRVAIGQKAPDFSANKADGNSVQLSEFLGKGYVLVDFWASWCVPCRKESPYLVKAYSTYQSKGFEIIGVSLDNTPEPWLKAIEKDKLNWTQLIDKNAWAGDGVTNYAVRLIPANFLIDKNGVIVAKNLKGEELLKTLDELLN